ncbi:sensor histidine kinase [Nonomuraea sp. NBC_01738]|uniref:sensor histidine kinase n=1 Tax=Nonomuraea sp. NBC_01738 TaxID=2976003 RepID=UPI002E15A0E6|nr:sensor histidine kinase [Nonomuraea sp. NBC_01738]
MRSYPFWDGFFGLVMVATIVGIVADTTPPYAKAIAIGLLLGIAVAYALVGRWAIRAPVVPIRASWRFATAMFPMFTFAVLIEPGTAVALSALIPMIFMSFRLAQAIAGMVIIFAGPAVNFLELAGLHPVLIGVAVVIAVPGGALFGYCIDRLARQNAERLRLIEELDRTRDELAEVSKEAGMLAERERLAGDLHDTLAQGLTGIIMLLQAAEPDVGENRHVALAVESARETLAETRALIAAMAPPALAGSTLAEALDRLARGFPMPVEVGVSGPVTPLAAEAEVVLLRAAQEGLANVRKHAEAAGARLDLDYGPGRVRLTISDDGRGIAGDPDEADGFGLRAMRGRAAQLGGGVTIESAPGGGTRVEVELPCSV